MVKSITWKEAKKFKKEMYDAHEFLTMPLDEAKKLLYPGGKYEPFWLKGGLLARSGNVFGHVYDRRGVVADYQPSLRFGVLYVLDEKPHKHEFKKQPEKCGCGEVKE